MKLASYILFLIFILSANACMDDDDWFEMNELDLGNNPAAQDEIKKQAGVFIINEGNFMYDNASLSYYMIDSRQVINDVFYRSNQTPLGDVAQSMTIRNSLGYIVVNNSSKIYVININTFEYVGKIPGLMSPRYIHFISDNKAYVSDLYSGSVTVIDPQTFSITGYIDLGNPDPYHVRHTSEEFVQLGKYVYTNSWNYDNQIFVIDTETDQIVDSIYTLEQPNSMVIDKFDRLWVLCDGGFEGSPHGYSSPGLGCIRLDVRIAVLAFAFDHDSNPVELSISGTKDTLYFINKHVYRYILGQEDPPKVFIRSDHENNGTGGFYGLDIDPYSGDIYVADAIDQVRSGIVYRYKANGTLIDTFNVGINPGSFCFREKEGP